ncbi:hypothetical protein E4U61_006483 [Claviceps capensis]|nr:hypothetical protein E4U61_006483 [Claviceps capensis]
MALTAVANEPAKSPLFGDSVDNHPSRTNRHGVSTVAWLAQNPQSASIWNLDDTAMKWGKHGGGCPAPLTTLRNDEPRS